MGGNETNYGIEYTDLFASDSVYKKRSIRGEPGGKKYPVYASRTS